MSATVPRVIELAGLPAAGKTTTAALVARSFELAGISCKIVAEAAERFPVPDRKMSWEFNAWTTCQTICSIIENAAAADTQVLILDRGLVDSLCWMRWFHDRKAIGATAFQALVSLARVDQWFGRIHEVFVLRVAFETAETRRGSRGRIVNPDVFATLRMAYDAVFAEMLERPMTPALAVLDTDSLTREEVAAWVVEHTELML